MDRRTFINKAGWASLALVTPGIPFEWIDDINITRITLLHTNDVHSRIDPFPDDGSRNAGMGGASKRAALINHIRNQEEHVVLLDAGDIFQGTPYFNFYDGELEIKLMSAMQYDAATIGNHDFDGGIDGLEKQLVHANFPFVICNYDFSNTVMAGKTRDHLIIQKKDIKIGITGVGIQLEGLVPGALYKETVYMDPVRCVQIVAKRLKHELKCDYVICLSHLGYRYNHDKVSDYVLATETQDIDLIIGGHTHTFMRQPDFLKNKSGQPVIINQVGWAGIMLGRLDVLFERNKKGKCISCSNTFIT
ncbi:MAG TPA: metallophosphatase [Saprospiraceae bacterium]|nr:metallophosphatase [Saprospiraceae bacterium]